MADEATISIDTTEAESAATHAELSAQQADEATAAATAAAINQAQIIGVVTEAARSDAERARDQAESAAVESRQAAELSALAGQSALDEMRAMLDEHRSRLDALETRSNQPVVVNQDSVTPINPQEVENSAREESMSDGEEKAQSGGRKGHGRRRR